MEIILSTLVDYSRKNFTFTLARDISRSLSTDGIPSLCPRLHLDSRALAP